MTHHVLEMPITEAQTRALRVGDTVTLERTLYGIRDATLIAMFDRARKTKLDLRGHAVVHTAPNVHTVPLTAECPTGYTPLCIGTTTSMRMERFTRPLMEREGVRIIIGKGGLARATRRVPRTRRRLSRGDRRRRGAANDVDRGDRGRRHGRSPPGKPVALPHPASARCW